MFFTVHNALTVHHTALVIIRNSGKELNLSALGHQHTSISGAVNSKKSVNLEPHLFVLSVLTVLPEGTRYYFSTYF
jgi:hypothetical protein